MESSSNGLRSVSSTVDRKDPDRLRNSLICFPREARKRETFSCCLTVGFWGRLLISYLSLDLLDIRTRLKEI
jgi:hypothetical protein